MADILPLASALAMGLAKKFNYHWRIFLPLASLLWFAIGGLFLYQYGAEKHLRRKMVEDQLENINATILGIYAQGANLQSYVDFIDELNSGTSLDDLRITVYRRSDHAVLADNPEPTNFFAYPDSTFTPDVAQARSQGKGTSIRQAVSNVPGQPGVMLMFHAMISADEQILSIVALPLNATASRAMAVNPAMWVVVVLLGIFVTMIAYLTTRRMSRAVLLLRDFADRAAGGEPLNVDDQDFTHDELGDVSRQIMSLYRAKAKALERSDHDHKMAMRAQQEKERVKRSMTNNLNHELKTPVGVIKGYLDTICSDPDMPESLRTDFLNKARQHTDRLTALLQDVSTLTRLGEGGGKLEKADFDFHDLVFDLENDLEVSGAAGSMAFESEIPFDCMVHSNVSLITGALMNLVRNSAAYSHGTTIRLVLCGEDERFYTFAFLDDGVGVSEQHLPQLFDRFYRVDEGRSRKSGGTGLGLSIVKSTFETLGGDITVSNVKPHGLRFTFTLPRA